MKPLFWNDKQPYGNSAYSLEKWELTNLSKEQLEQQEKELRFKKLCVIFPELKDLQNYDEFISLYFDEKFKVANIHKFTVAELMIMKNYIGVATGHTQLFDLLTYFNDEANIKRFFQTAFKDKKGNLKSGWEFNQPYYVLYALPIADKLREEILRPFKDITRNNAKDDFGSVTQSFPDIPAGKTNIDNSTVKGNLSPLRSASKFTVEYSVEDAEQQKLYKKESFSLKINTRLSALKELYLMDTIDLYKSTISDLITQMDKKDRTGQKEFLYQFEYKKFFNTLLEVELAHQEKAGEMANVFDLLTEKFNGRIIEDTVLVRGVSKKRYTSKDLERLRRNKQLEKLVIAMLIKEGDIDYDELVKASEKVKELQHDMVDIADIYKRTGGLKFHTNTAHISSKPTLEKFKLDYREDLGTNKEKQTTDRSTYNPLQISNFRSKRFGPDRSLWPREEIDTILKSYPYSAHLALSTAAAQQLEETWRNLFDKKEVTDIQTRLPIRIAEIGNVPHSLARGIGITGALNGSKITSIVSNEQWLEASKEQLKKGKSKQEAERNAVEKHTEKEICASSLENLSFLQDQEPFDLLYTSSFDELTEEKQKLLLLNLCEYTRKGGAFACTLRYTLSEKVMNIVESLGFKIIKRCHDFENYDTDTANIESFELERVQKKLSYGQFFYAVKTTECNSTDIARAREQLADVSFYESHTQAVFETVGSDFDEENKLNNTKRVLWEVLERSTTPAHIAMVFKVLEQKGYFQDFPEHLVELYEKHIQECKNPHIGTIAILEGILKNPEHSIFVDLETVAKVVVNYHGEERNVIAQSLYDFFKANADHYYKDALCLGKQLAGSDCTFTIVNGGKQQESVNFGALYQYMELTDARKLMINDCIINDEKKINLEEVLSYVHENIFGLEDTLALNESKVDYASLFSLGIEDYTVEIEIIDVDIPQEATELKKWMKYFTHFRKSAEATSKIFACIHLLFDGHFDVQGKDLFFLTNTNGYGESDLSDILKKLATIKREGKEITTTHPVIKECIAQLEEYLHINKITEGSFQHTKEELFIHCLQFFTVLRCTDQYRALSPLLGSLEHQVALRSLLDKDLLNSQSEVTAREAIAIFHRVFDHIKNVARFANGNLEHFLATPAASTVLKSFLYIALSFDKASNFFASTPDFLAEKVSEFVASEEGIAFLDRYFAFLEGEEDVQDEVELYKEKIRELPTSLQMPLLAYLDKKFGNVEVIEGIIESEMLVKEETIEEAGETTEEQNNFELPKDTEELKQYIRDMQAEELLGELGKLLYEFYLQDNTADIDIRTLLLERLLQVNKLVEFMSFNLAVKYAIELGLEHMIPHYYSSNSRQLIRSLACFCKGNKDNNACEQFINTYLKECYNATPLNSHTLEMLEEMCKWITEQRKNTYAISKNKLKKDKDSHYIAEYLYNNRQSFVELNIEKRFPILENLLELYVEYMEGRESVEAVLAAIDSYRTAMKSTGSSLVQNVHELSKSQIRLLSKNLDSAVRSMTCINNITKEQISAFSLCNIISSASLFYLPEHDHLLSEDGVCSIFGFHASDTGERLIALKKELAIYEKIVNRGKSNDLYKYIHQEILQKYGAEIDNGTTSGKILFKCLNASDKKLYWFIISQEIVIIDGAEGLEFQLFLTSDDSITGVLAACMKKTQDQLALDKFGELITTYISRSNEEVSNTVHAIVPEFQEAFTFLLKNNAHGQKILRNHITNPLIDEAIKYCIEEFGNDKISYSNNKFSIREGILNFSDIKEILEKTISALGRFIAQMPEWLQVLAIEDIHAAQPLSRWQQIRPSDKIALDQKLKSILGDLWEKSKGDVIQAHTPSSEQVEEINPNNFTTKEEVDAYIESIGGKLVGEKAKELHKKYYLRGQTPEEKAIDAYVYEKLLEHDENKELFILTELVTLDEQYSVGIDFYKKHKQHYVKEVISLANIKNQYADYLTKNYTPYDLFAGVTINPQLLNAIEQVMSLNKDRIEAIAENKLISYILRYLFATYIATNKTKESEITRYLNEGIHPIKHTIDIGLLYEHPTTQQFSKIYSVYYDSLTSLRNSTVTLKLDLLPLLEVIGILSLDKNIFSKDVSPIELLKLVEEHKKKFDKGLDKYFKECSRAFDKGVEKNSFFALSTLNNLNRYLKYHKYIDDLNPNDRRGNIFQISIDNVSKTFEQLKDLRSVAEMILDLSSKNSVSKKFYQKYIKPNAFRISYSRKADAKTRNEFYIRAVFEVQGDKLFIRNKGYHGVALLNEYLFFDDVDTMPKWLEHGLIDGLTTNEELLSSLTKIALHSPKLLEQLPENFVMAAIVAYSQTEYGKQSLTNYIEMMTAKMSNLKSQGQDILTSTKLFPLPKWFEYLLYTFDSSNLSSLASKAATMFRTLQGRSFETPDIVKKAFEKYAHLLPENNNVKSEDKVSETVDPDFKKDVDELYADLSLRKDLFEAYFMDEEQPIENKVYVAEKLISDEENMKFLPFGPFLKGLLSLTHGKGIYSEYLLGMAFSQIVKQASSNFKSVVEIPQYLSEKDFDILRQYSDENIVNGSTAYQKLFQNSEATKENLQCIEDHLASLQITRENVLTILEKYPLYTGLIHFLLKEAIDIDLFRPRSDKKEQKKNIDLSGYNNCRMLVNLGRTGICWFNEYNANLEKFQHWSECILMVTKDGSKTFDALLTSTSSLTEIRDQIEELLRQISRHLRNTKENKYTEEFYTDPFFIRKGAKYLLLNTFVSFYEHYLLLGEVQETIDFLSNKNDIRIARALFSPISHMVDIEKDLLSAQTYCSLFSILKDSKLQESINSYRETIAKRYGVEILGANACGNPMKEGSCVAFTIIERKELQIITATDNLSVTDLDTFSGESLFNKKIAETCTYDPYLLEMLYVKTFRNQNYIFAQGLKQLFQEDLHFIPEALLTTEHGQKVLEKMRAEKGVDRSKLPQWLNDVLDVKPQDIENEPTQEVNGAKRGFFGKMIEATKSVTNAVKSVVKGSSLAQYKNATEALDAIKSMNYFKNIAIDECGNIFKQCMTADKINIDVVYIFMSYLLNREGMEKYARIGAVLATIIKYEEKYGQYKGKLLAETLFNFYKKHEILFYPEALMIRKLVSQTLETTEEQLPKKYMVGGQNLFEMYSYGTLTNEKIQIIENVLSKDSYQFVDIKNVMSYLLSRTSNKNVKLQTLEDYRKVPKKQSLEKMLARSGHNFKNAKTITNIIEDIHDIQELLQMNELIHPYLKEHRDFISNLSTYISDEYNIEKDPSIMVFVENMRISLSESQKNSVIEVLAKEMGQKRNTRLKRIPENVKETMPNLERVDKLITAMSQENLDGDSRFAFVKEKIKAYKYIRTLLYLLHIVESAAEQV